MNSKTNLVFALAVVAMLVLLGALPALAGKTEIISVSSSGTQGNSDSYEAAISADGRFVAFYSYADNIVPGDTNGMCDAFVRELATGITELISVSSTGEQGNMDSYAQSISTDGRYVTFTSRALNLVPDHMVFTDDVFVRDRVAGTTECVSVTSSGEYVGDHSYGGMISADGRYVMFDSIATSLVPDDTNRARDVFVHDRQTGVTKRISVSDTGEQGNSNSYGTGISADGLADPPIMHVAFWSMASNLVPGDTNECSDVFVCDYVGNVSSMRRVSVSSAGVQGDKGSESGGWISADGNCVAFNSWATNLVPGSVNGKVQSFVNDRSAGVTELVSVSSSGEIANKTAESRAISANGRYVVIASAATNLVPGDANGKDDVFVYDRYTDVPKLVSIAYDGAQGNDGSGSCSISGDGSLVMFQSGATNLIPSDTNGRIDVFVRNTDDVSPTVTINQASEQPDPASASPICFTAVFSEPVSGFATGDVTLSGTAGPMVATVTGSGSTYNVAVSGMTSGGTVIASIAAGVALDSAGNINWASTSTDNVVTLNTPPKNNSLSPSGGTLGASAATLTAVYSDGDGYPNIKKAYLLVNDSLGQSNATLFHYDRSANKVYLKNDANTSWGTGYTPGTNITLQNSQCFFYVKDTTVSGIGKNLTVNWRIALKSPFVSKQLNGYMCVQDVGGLSDGWDKMGVYYNLGPQVVSIAPNDDVLPIDTKTTLTGRYRDANGYNDLRKCYVLVCEDLNQVNAVFLYYDKGSNKVYLKNDSNTSWGTGYILGTDVTLSNSQCEVYVKDTTLSASAADLAVRWSFKLKASMAEKKLQSWMYATDSKGLYDGWKKVGTHFTPIAPTCVGVTPSTGKVQTGTPLVLTTEYADDNGYADIHQCFFQMGQTGSNANAVCVLYDAKQNKVFLRNDANTAWTTGYTPGTDVTLENNQCIVYVMDTTVTPSGPDNLIVDWKITLKPILIGKLLGERMYCRDNEYMNSNWKLKGYVRGR